MFRSRYQTSLWTLIISSLMFVKLDDTRKLELLSSWKQLFFEIFVSIDLLGPKGMILSFAHYFPNTLWTLINCCLTYVMCDNTRKSRQKVFHHWKDCFFFKTFVFQQPFRSQKKALIGSRVIVRIAYGPLYFVPWCLSHSAVREKTGQKLLSSWKQLFLRNVRFYWPLRCKKIDFIICKKICQNTLWTLPNCSLTFVMSDNKKKKRPIFFSSLEKLPFFFFKIFCFQRFLRS